MGFVQKFSSIFLMSGSAFLGVYYLKICLIKVNLNLSDYSLLVQSIPILMLEWQFWVSMFFYIMTMIVLIYLLNYEEVSTISPQIVGINMIITVIGAVLFLGDVLDIKKLIAISLILVGVLLIN